MPFTLTKRPGSDNWYIRGTDPDSGRKVFRTTKTSDRKTAEALLVQHEARILVERVHGKVATVTFEEAAKSYIASGGESQYLIRKRSDGEVLGLIPYLGDHLLSKISQEDLDRAALALCQRGASRETLIRNVYTPFIAVWNFAAAASRKWAEPRKWERPRKAKGTNVSRLSPMRAGTHPVDYERAAKFVAAMSPAPAMLMTALFYTGMRPIELFALSADDVDVGGRWVTLPSSKTGEPRGIPIHNFLVPLFAALVAQGGAIFRTPRGVAYEPKDDGGGQMKSAINGARRRSGIKDIAPYTARHTVSTQLVINGVHPHIKDQILGHAVDDMSRHYTNVPQKALIDAIDTLPVPSTWRALPWWEDPVKWQRRLADGTGRRTDLLGEKRA